ncbi:MAG: ABC transporter ATP-binding protein [Rhodococcus sp.]|nr:ABC transporter ATP-binding protein [Rhodococcus sp. (in: high G+C Gram-positive bacteria)]
MQARSTGEMKKILHDDVEQLEEALGHGIPDLAAAIAVPITTTVLLFVVDWRLGLVALASLILLIVLSAVGMAIVFKSHEAAAAQQVRLNSAIMGYLRGIAVIRGFVRPDSGYNQARDVILEAEQLDVARVAGKTSWLVTAMSVATGLATAMLLPVAGHGYVSGWVSLADLTLFLVISQAYLTPVISLVGVVATIIARIQLSSKAITELLDEPSLPSAANPGTRDGAVVELRDVTFAYGDGHPVLSEVNLTIEEGTHLALVGPTGAGKSTLAKLIARFQDVTEGSVTIGGVDVRELSDLDMARTVAFVQQDEYVFGASLLENIRVAAPEATEEQVIGAGEAAQLGDVVSDLPNGWHSELAAGGAGLSGGQRQRISIARALVKNSPIVILDEVTASLDAHTERATLAALDQLLEGRTVVSIAHRLSTIIDSDLIAVVADGGIVERGTHSQLLDSSARYQDLWESYTGATGWQIEDAPVREIVFDDTSAVTTETASVSDQEAAQRVEEARGVVRQDVGELSFGKQWKALYGRSWGQLVRQGLPRFIIESMLQGVPLIAVFLVLDAAIRAAEGTSEMTSGFVWTVSIVLVVALLGRLAAIQWVNQLVWRLAARSKADVQLSIVERLRRVPLGFFQRMDVGKTSTLVTNDIPMIDFQNVPQKVVASVMQPLYASIALLIVDWRLALAALAGIPVFLVLTVWSDRIYHRVFADLHTQREKTTAVLLDQVRGTAVLRGSPGSPLADSYISAVHDLEGASTRNSTRATPASSLGSAALEMGLVLLIVVGATLFQSGQVAPTVLLLSLVVYQPIQELSGLTGYRRNQEQIAARIAAVWDTPELSEPEIPAEAKDSSVEFVDVSFQYEADDLVSEREPALSGVSFRAEPGRITALVGPSGSGKSTSAHLISRLWDTTSGQVRIGGVDVRDLGSDRVQQLVTTVFQEVYLFPDTVRYNVTLGRPEATDDEIWAALTAARADDFVRALPDGLDTVVGDGGSGFSGGERQRLSIARALLKDTPILILDEAVASVDPDTEAQIQAALGTLAAGRTVIVVAHRMSTIEQAHSIVVLDKGKVDGVGTFTQLRDTSATFRSLVEASGELTEA